MKIIIAIIAIIFFSVCSVSAQFELKSLSISIGKSATTSGYDITTGFSNGVNNFQITGNHQRMYATYSIPIGIDIFSCSISGGFFKNCPWVGPLVVFKPVGFLSTTHWYGFSAGHPDAPALKANVLIEYNAITLNFSNFSTSCAILTFDGGEIDYIPGVKYSDKINDSWIFFVSSDYSMNKKEPLFLFGLKHMF